MNNFTSQETSKKLFELTGWKSDYTYYSNAGELIDHSPFKVDMVFEKEGNVPAYNTDFLLDKMPNKIEEDYSLNIIKNNDRFWATYNKFTGSPLSFEIEEMSDKNPAEALAQTIIWLMENGYMEVEK